MMRIIGAGFGRTGTMSLCAALEKLGYDPCYHMIEVFKHPSHIRIWQDAADGKDVDWQAFLGKYGSGLDYPVVGFYKELMAAFPEARVILTVRDPAKWYESTIETIYQGTFVPEWLLRFLPPFRNLARMIDATAWQRIFDGRFEERDYALKVYADHVAEVQRVVPAGKLLVFEVKEGWGPLCQFLDAPVPDEPFPHVNDRQMTKRGYLLARVVAVVLVIILLLIAIAVLQAILKARQS